MKLEEMTERQGTFWKTGQGARKAVKLSLFSNIQFIYELALARLELDSLGVKFQIADGLREFRASYIPDLELLRRRTAYFSKVETVDTDYYHITRRNRARSVNQYLTHWIYPYKGKFHPQMIRALLNVMGLHPGQTVLDPFIGSGTTAVEAVLLGVNCIGFDISPLCILQSKVKVDSVSALSQIREAKPGIIQAIGNDNPSPGDLFELVNGLENPLVRDFYFMVCLVSVSDSTRRRRNFKASLQRNVDLMCASVEDFAEVVEQLGLTLGQAELKEADAHQLPLEDGSVDGIITSPPYSIALDYVGNDAHAFKALGLDLEQLRERFIGGKGQGAKRVALYDQDMAQSFEEMGRVLKPGGLCTIVIGDASFDGQRIPTVDFTIKQCRGAGIRLIHNIPKIIFGLYNVMQTENILIFQKR